MGKPNQSKLIKRNLSHLEKNIKGKYKYKMKKMMYLNTSVQAQDLEQE